MGRIMGSSSYYTMPSPSFFSSELAKLYSDTTRRVDYLLTGMASQYVASQEMDRVRRQLRRLAEAYFLPTLETLRNSPDKQVRSEAERLVQELESVFDQLSLDEVKSGKGTQQDIPLPKRKALAPHIDALVKKMKQLDPSQSPSGDQQEDVKKIPLFIPFHTI